MTTNGGQASLRLRVLGMTADDRDRVAGFIATCERRGLRVVTAEGGPAVALGPGSPSPGVATGPDGSFLVLDGELFADTGAASPDDAAATVLAALRSGGSSALRSLEIEGTVTWWDARAGSLLLARDAGGVAPLLVGRVGTASVWSSEPDALLAAGVAPELDPLAVDQLLTLGWVTPPRSFLRDVCTVPAGHLVTFGPGPRFQPWYLHTAGPPLPGDDEEQSRLLGQAITAAVARRAGGRLGAFLSAGVDSTVVVAVLRRTLDLPVETFTFHYHGYEGQLNEDEFAAGTAAFLGAPHHRIDVHPHELVDRFASIVAEYQGPITFGVHSFKQDDVRALGLDAVLGGSDPGFWRDQGHAAAVAARLRRAPHGALRAALALGRRARGLPKVGVLHSGSLLAAHGTMNEYLSPAERQALHGRFAESQEALASSLRDATAPYAGEPIGRRTGFVFEQFAVPEFVGLWNHRWGRANGYPVRAPLWDKEVMATAEHRRDISGDKPLLRRYAATLVPRERAYAPKVYQEMPLGHWFRGPLRDFLGDALAPDRVRHAGLEPAAVQHLVEQHLSGADRRWPLWTALTITERALQLRERPVEPLLR